MSLSTTSNHHIEDEELIEELKRYGEKNLPVIGSTSTTTAKTLKGRKSAGGSQLTEQNRDIYLKKLNHYRAREKAEQNPSKYLKQATGGVGGGGASNNTMNNTSDMSHNVKVKRRSSAHFRLEENMYYDHDELEDNNDDTEQQEDVIEINNGRPSTNNTTCEYIPCSDAHTSPMSNTTYGGFDQEEENDHEDDDNEVIIERHLPASPTRHSASNYENLNLDLKLRKEKIELDKTLSKYRNEIQSIISGSLVKSRTSPMKSEPIVSSTTTLYCPKVTNKSNSTSSRSVFDSIKSVFSRDEPKTKDEESERAESSRGGGDSYYKLSQIRGGHADLRQRIASSQASRQQEKELPVKSSFKDWRIKQRFSYFGNNILMPFLTGYLPYIMIAVLTVIFLQYLRVAYQQSGTATVDDGGVFQSTSNIQQQMVNTAYCWDVKDIRCSQTKTLVKELIDYLRLRSGQVDCSPLADSPANLNPSTVDTKTNPAFIEKCVHLNTVINYLTRERGLIKQADQVKEAMESVLSAVQRNPHWKLRLLNSGYMDTYTSEDVTYVMSTVSVKSLRCRLVDLVHFIYVRLVMLGFLALTGVLVWVLARALRNINKEREQQFFAMVSQVTSMVERQYELSLSNDAIKPYVAISHVYDTLVEPSQRAKKRTLWSKVVKFIEDNESRIHLETQFIDGEETHVWKWVLSKHPTQIKRPVTPPRPPQIVITPSTISTGANKINNDGIGLANSTMMHPSHNHHVESSSSHSKIHEIKAANGGIYLDQLTSHNMHSGVGAHVYASHQYEPESSDMNRVNFSSNQNASSQQQQQQQQQQGNTAWQGEAFNRSEKLANSPTPCLKIRNMFDQSEVEQDGMLAVRIHNDILEKCCAVQRHPLTGQPINLINDSILHIVCDKKSKEGCVYVKCASNEAAGRVYQILNGVWYQNKLLNVKFLKSDRYLERFPDSALFTKPIQPIVM